MRNLLNLSYQQTAEFNNQLFTHPDKDVTFDAEGSPHLVDPLMPDQQVGPFKIIQRLGRGGMGTVYEAQDCSNQRRVALKVLSRPVTNDEARQRFLREGRLAASINHPNSVFVFGTHQIDSLSLISMELVGGGTLESRIRHHGPMPPRQAVDTALQLIDGLIAAHERGILHRDIKPSNCFVGDDGIVKIGDFGLSISSDPEFNDRITTQGAMLGTPAFSSPEQLRGDALDIRSDIYALGGTLYYLLTGKTPFSADGVVKIIAMVLEGTIVAPNKLNSEIPAELSQIVLRCLSKEPGDRFRSYQELRAALQPLGTAFVEPASLGMRSLAMMIEWLVLVVLGIAISFVTTSTAITYIYGFLGLGTNDIGSLLFWPAVFTLYFAAAESVFGCSLGKWLLQLRVVDQNRKRPSFITALGRAAVFLAIPNIPMWIYGVYAYLRFGSLEFSIDGPEVMTEALVGLSAFVSYWLLIGVLFAGARNSNGWLGLHDWLSGTQVIQLFAPQVQSVSLSIDQDHQLALDQTIGTYSILGELATGDESQLLVGFDPVLLRRVWLPRDSSNGDSPVHPQIARATRLRWLNRIEAQEQSWDVFEYTEGQSLIAAVGNHTDWNSARRWLDDLQNELSLATSHDQLPTSLTLDNLWLTKDGRLKLLDFPAPVSKDSLESETKTTGPLSNSTSVSDRQKKSSADRANELLVNVSHQLKSALQAKLRGQLPPPLFVTQLLDRLSRTGDFSSKIDALKTTVAKPQKSDRKRLALMSVTCCAFPIISTILTLFGHISSELYFQQNEDVRELQVLVNIALNDLQTASYNMHQPESSLYSDVQTVIAGKFHHLLDNKSNERHHRFTKGMFNLHPKLWDDMTKAMEAPVPSESETEEAYERIKAAPVYKGYDELGSINWFDLTGAVKRRPNNFLHLCGATCNSRGADFQRRIGCPWI